MSDETPPSSRGYADDWLTLQPPAEFDDFSDFELQLGDSADTALLLRLRWLPAWEVTLEAEDLQSWLATKCAELGDGGNAEEALQPLSTPIGDGWAAAIDAGTEQGSLFAIQLGEEWMLQGMAQHPSATPHTDAAPLDEFFRRCHPDPASAGEGRVVSTPSFGLALPETAIWVPRYVFVQEGPDSQHSLTLQYLPPEELSDVGEGAEQRPQRFLDEDVHAQLLREAGAGVTPLHCNLQHTVLDGMHLQIDGAFFPDEPALAIWDAFLAGVRRRS